MKYFDNIVGQDRVKKTLSFYLDGYKTNGIMKPLFLTAAKGFGKTMIIRQIGRNLLGTDNKPKKFLELNGASVKNLRRFIDGVVSPHISGSQECTLFIDEIHSVDQDVLDWMLSVLAVDHTNETKAVFDGQTYFFNYSRFSFLAASTNAEKLSKPFLDRLRRIDLEPYTKPDLIKILQKNLSEIKFEDKIEEEIVTASRGNPRNIVHLSSDIKCFSNQKNTVHFGTKEWKELKTVLNIRPLGLNSSEYQLLKYLNKHGPQTLRCLGAVLGLDSVTVQKDIELYPLSQGLITVDTKRLITHLGQELLKECEEKD